MHVQPQWHQDYKKLQAGFIKTVKNDGQQIKQHIWLKKMNEYHSF